MKACSAGAACDMETGEMCCGGLHGVANTAYISGFLFPGLHRVAPYCVRGGVKVVSCGVRGTARMPASGPIKVEMSDCRISTEKVRAEVAGGIDPVAGMFLVPLL